jgi:hypothetical protein
MLACHFILVGLETVLALGKALNFPLGLLELAFVLVDLQLGVEHSRGRVKGSGDAAEEGSRRQHTHARRTST